MNNRKNAVLNGLAPVSNWQTSAHSQSTTLPLISLIWSHTHKQCLDRKISHYYSIFKSLQDVNASPSSKQSQSLLALLISLCYLQQLTNRKIDEERKKKCVSLGIQMFRAYKRLRISERNVPWTR